MEQHISWYPGHMAKARRLLAEQIGRVDAVVELCDARLPLSSRNPELGDLTRGKPVLLLLGKADLADPAATARWTSYFTSKGMRVMAADVTKSRAQILKALLSLTRPVTDRARERGLPRAARAMVLGVPNVGKSTLINLLAGRRALKVQDKPGVTRAPQWVTVGPGLEMLDSPGLLWPKLGDPVAARRLAFIAAIRDEVLDVYQLSLQLLDELAKVSPMGVFARYGITGDNLRGQAMLEAIGRARGFLLPGAVVDVERAAVTVLDEFRAGLLGRVTLEMPPEAGNGPG
ncbi:MAG TPA: ribosome biogenesis GTPase YlqF [Candidatus Limnocylindria bacterium]|nr:ribosome biogenesis GTPase YlqF [Candidatus Limnocylindria bacterium]